jgi:hypothetical protein
MYFLVGGTCLLVVSGLAYTSTNEKRLLRTVGLIHISLGSEVILGLRYQVGNVARALIHDLGVYTSKVLYQLALVAVLLGVCFLVANLIRNMKSAPQNYRLICFFTLISVATFCLEAISIHWIDMLFYSSIGPVKILLIPWLFTTLPVLYLCVCLKSPSKLRRKERRGTEKI